MRKLKFEEKKLKETLKKSRMVQEDTEHTFRPVLTVPDPPPFFGDAARREWADLVPVLVEAGNLETVDLPALQSYCMSIQVVEEFAAILKKEGYMTEYTNKGGETNTIVHPAVAAMEKAQRMMVTIAARFGFDPISRKRLSQAPAKKEKAAEDPFETAIRTSAIRSN